MSDFVRYDTTLSGKIHFGTITAKTNEPNVKITSVKK